MIFKYIEERTENLLIENNFLKTGFDVSKLIKKLNVELVGKNFEGDVSGLFVMTDNKAVISFNKNEDPKRIRFTMAHELGHYILHSKEQPFFIDKSPKVMYRNAASTTGDVLKEREANAFAAALLMPKVLIDEEISNCPTGTDDVIKHLAKNFKVSEQAMSFRMSNLGYYIG